MKRSIRWALGALAVTTVIAGGTLGLRFRRDLRAARARLAAIDHEVVETAGPTAGPVEVATWGEGDLPVIVAHGIFGGFDQGLTMAKGWLDPTAFAAIAPSRFGYLGTPLPPDATPADQADAYAALLDALEIERAGIIGTSAGGTAALQFALRHPARCAGLVLVASNAPSEAAGGLPPRPVAERLFRSDLLFWVLTTYFDRRLRPMMGVPKGYPLTPEDEAQIATMMAELLPMAERADGGLYDMFVGNPHINTGYALDEITVPTLVVHAVDDPLADYETAVAMADRIPDAQLLTVDAGGHLLLGDDGTVPTEIQAFLQDAEAER